MLEAAQAGSIPHGRVGQVEQQLVGRRQFVSRRLPGGFLIGRVAGRHPDQEIQRVRREFQAEFLRRRAFPQSALSHGVLPEIAFAPPATGPDQNEHAALGQAVLHQGHGVGTETRRPIVRIEKPAATPAPAARAAGKSAGCAAGSLQSERRFSWAIGLSNVSEKCRQSRCRKAIDGQFRCH